MIGRIDAVFVIYYFIYLCKYGNVIIFIFVQFDDGKTHFETDEFNENNLRKFVITESLPLIVDFNHETAQKIFGGEINSHLLMFLSQSAGHYESHLEAAKSIAKDYRDKVCFFF